MGLDMYAYTVEKDRFDNVVDTTEQREVFYENKTDLFYWRKHPNLHGWMEQHVYVDEYGGEDEFNCIPVKLDERLLDLLQCAVVNGLLPETDGFFFGKSLPEEKKTDLEFIAQARKAISAGKDVYYDSWW